MHATTESSPQSPIPTPGDSPDPPPSPRRVRAVAVVLRVLFFGSALLAVAMSYVGPIGELPAYDLMRWVVGVLAATCLALGALVSKVWRR